MSGGSINPLGLIGGVLGASSSGNATQSASKDPWGPAQPYILSNIDSASNLQKFYQDNPLSPLQQTAYANMFSGSDNARQALAFLSGQLNNDKGWSSGSGNRLPVGYTFPTLGGASSNQGGYSNLGSGYLPTVGSYARPASSMPVAIPRGPQMAVDTSKYGGGGYGGDGGLNAGAPGAYADTTSGASKTAAGLLAAAGITGLMNSVNSAAQKAGIPSYTPASTPGRSSVDGGGYSGIGGTTSATGGGIAANPMGIDPATAQGQGGGGGGGGDKIICTAMNDAYGFGSYRQAIWLKYSERMTKEHERGYHKLFLPLVKYAFHSGDGFGKRIVRAVLEHGARHRTADLRAVMYGRKRDTLGRIYRAIFEPMCYVAGKA